MEKFTYGVHDYSFEFKFKKSEFKYGVHDCGFELK
jgi:hypothetical protein